jgi:hypothetical protein
MGLLQATNPQNLGSEHLQVGMLLSRLDNIAQNCMSGFTSLSVDLALSNRFYGSLLNEFWPVKARLENIRYILKQDTTLEVTTLV